MFYCGIDPSLTGTGIVVLNENLEIAEQKLITTKSSDEIENRLESIVSQIISILEKYTPINVNIEGLSFGSRGQSMLELAGLHYLIRISLKGRCINYEMVPPTVIKKFVTGKGNCKKNLMLLNVYKKYGISFEDDNLCDAYCLSRICFERWKSSGKM